MSTAQRFHLPANSAVAGIRFRPGMASSFIKGNLSSLTDTFANAESLWPEWRRKLGDAGSAEALLEILRGSLPHSPETPNNVQRALTFISAFHGAVSLDEVIRPNRPEYAPVFAAGCFKRADSLPNSSAAYCGFAGLGSSLSPPRQPTGPRSRAIPDTSINRI